MHIMFTSLTDNFFQVMRPFACQQHVVLPLHNAFVDSGKGCTACLCVARYGTGHQKGEDVKLIIRGKHGLDTIGQNFYTILFHSLFKVEFNIDHFVLGGHREH